MRNLVTQEKMLYGEIYHALQQVRETFHREGRISDANAKLDETVKFLAIHYGYLKNLVEESTYTSLCNFQTFKVSVLNNVFSQLASDPIFFRQGMGSIFGSMPSTVFEDGDERIACELFNATGQAFQAQASSQRKLDILNEAYGHHVRDNFRNHIEDAQYMTPPEVVNFMVNLALELVPRPKAKLPCNLLVADPSCGVGSFLIAWRAAYRLAYGDKVAQALKCIGQDKVDRMVRLSAINLIFSDTPNDDVFLGNTIQDESPLSAYNNQVDLILTNPPFGARFAAETLQHMSRESTPFFVEKIPKKKVIDSELLFLDRYLTLLKPGGVCLAVVPDGVVSSKGTAAVMRQHLARSAEIVSVIELPAVTFAQAGTRTKTAILGFRKKNNPQKNYAAFFSEVYDLGFQVSKRKGVPIKKFEGINQLPDVLEAFRSPIGRVIKTKLSVDADWRNLNPAEQDAWTPRTMLFDRKALEKRSFHNLVSLKDLTEPPFKRKPEAYTENTYFISVLHIIGEGILDLPGIKSYQPVTPGLPVEGGEVILSRINPRIPRVAVVPNLGRKLLCSSEYEILRPKSGVSPYLLAFILLSPFVQKQIQSLTAGTSASHSRIKPGKVYDLLVPDLMDTDSSEIRIKLKKYEKACKKITTSLIEIEQVRQTLKN